jgi:hypothetical protein
MKSLKYFICIAVTVTFALTFTSAFAVEKTTKVETTKVVPAPDPAITGMVEIKKDPKGAVSDIALITAEGAKFKVIANETGVKMGKELNGQMAEVTAELTVLTYKKFTVPEKIAPPSVAEKEEETVIKVIEKTEESEKEAVEKLKEKVKETIAESAGWVGTVKATKGEKGKITAATFITGDGKIWKVALDENGTKMATELNGQKVEITFDLNVLTFKKVELEKLEKDMGKVGDKIEKEIKTEIKVIEKEPK